MTVLFLLTLFMNIPSGSKHAKESLLTVTYWLSDKKSKNFTMVEIKTKHVLKSKKDALLIARSPNCHSHGILFTHNVQQFAELDNEKGVCNVVAGFVKCMHEGCNAILSHDATISHSVLSLNNPYWMESKVFIMRNEKIDIFC